MKLITAKSAGSKLLTEYFRGDVPVGRAVYSDESKEFVFLPFHGALFSKDELEEISALLNAATSESQKGHNLREHQAAQGEGRTEP